MLCIQADKADLQQKIDKLQGEVQEVRRLLHSAEAGQSELRNCFQMLLSTVLASNQASNTSNNTTTSPLQHHNRQQEIHQIGCGGEIDLRCCFGSSIEMF
eukprot:TRINITY_DN37400_c0_g1_i4.p3 TRINITY_DN37400_c0_g1~~TRINITY_DN37400_c0_g1_i4.p3  ORF type:complete len:100 (+),score=15.32 TRINITY_DN37400_c0_g1_i4:101-400(+)